MAGRFDLDRFVQAQEPVIAAVRAELKAGRKTSHWMWFVFPQLAGLGLSQRAQFYGIASLEEARARTTRREQARRTTPRPPSPPRESL